MNRVPFKPDRPKWPVFKLLRIMRLATVILIATLMQVSASGFSQKKITYVKKKTTLWDLFIAIKAQTGYKVLWSDEVIKTSEAIEANFTNATIDEVMKTVLVGKPLTYVVQGEMVVIRRDKPSFRVIPGVAITAIDVRGRVLDEEGKPLVGAIVRVKDTKTVILTDNNGEFTLKSVGDKALLVISFLGYQTREILASESSNSIKLLMSNDKLDEVEIVSTGYQKIPKERATGSFVQIDNNLINRSVSPNILDRLDGVTSGLLFTKSSNIRGSQSSIEIRGRSTIFSNAEPLIILNDFPYNGNLSNINPNDVENITILKDAAAASIWGSRSGNGVIVITTKKGALNRSPKVSFNATLNIGSKPNLYYLPRLSSSQYIEVEDFLYDQGAYNSRINNGYEALSPAVEIFLAKRNGISDQDSLAKINILKTYDSREQELKYFYRQSVNQQYQASISGGGAHQKYFFSIGYDKSLNNDVTRSNNRITLNANNTYNLLENRLEFNVGMIYTGTNDKVSGIRAGFDFPYSQIADENGTALVVPRGLRPSYANTAGNGKFLNWLFRPLDELNNDQNITTTTLTDYRLDLSLSYKIIKGLKASLYYNFGKGLNEMNKLNKLDSYYTRNEVNKFSQINKTTGEVIYALPIGGVLNKLTGNIRTQSGRFQLDYNQTLGKHIFNLLAGSEIRETITFNDDNTFYGYDPENLTNQNSRINTTINYPLYYNPVSTMRININPSLFGANDRFLSYYFNGAYTYEEKYIFSLSIRKDESNIFGVTTNQKGVPLWSTGLAWNLSKENFYPLNWLPQLKLRGTFGYTGNVNTSISAYLTALAFGGLNLYNSSGALVIGNPPNPSLRWEKIRNINIGLDFSSKGNRITGSVDFWRKTGLDLIGNSPIAPQTGITLFTGNSANTVTRGVDIQINSLNTNGELKWMTTFLYNFQKSKVTKYDVTNGSNFNVVSGNSRNPLQGFPFYAMFSFKYAGLDAAGNPKGYLQGVPSSNYTGIRNSLNREELVYSGSAVPTSFGSLRNTFMYKEFDFSFNLIYKFGYFFRRNSLNNDQVYQGAFDIADYENRWKNPGDELQTNVPALSYPISGTRTSIYTYSDVLVEKGDHIRLQDIRLGYNFKKTSNLPFQNLNCFVYLNNLGVLWKANKKGIDPDFVTGIPSPRSFAIGLKADL